MIVYVFTLQFTFTFICRFVCWIVAGFVSRPLSLHILDTHRDSRISKDRRKREAEKERNTVEEINSRNTMKIFVNVLLTIMLMMVTMILLGTCATSADVRTSTEEDLVVTDALLRVKTTTVNFLELLRSQGRDAELEKLIDSVFVIDSPTRPSCPEGQRKDAHGKCRTPI